VNSSCDSSIDWLDAFVATAARRSACVAVEAADARLTFAELDRAANRLAHRLRDLGVDRDACVGISLPRGASELVAMLATAKAGGAYVPLVPSYPGERLRMIVDDAAPQVLLVHPHSPLRERAGGRVIVIDDLASATAGWPDDAPSVAADPERLAYVMFTSGSTGRPTGVEVTRGAFTNFLRSMAHTPGLSEHDRLLAITTTGFDISGLELCLPLFVGATVVIADHATTQDPRLLRRRLERGDITTMQATPATWRLLLEAGWQGDGRLRMMCGGEAMAPALAERLLAAGGELWNMYGPTETTVWSSVERIEPGFDRITIGRPIDDTRMLVVDEQLRELPVGGEGELVIGGGGLARGYRGRPETTAERFVDAQQGRLYRTGDLARRLADGRLEWLGRLDHQVKIRGFRIELGEVHEILRAVPGVAEVLVVADTRGGGEPRLVAYWVGTATRDALIAAARRTLPAYMVPAAYVELDAFPLTPNGKIDRARLPAPGAFVETSVEHLAPRDDTETRIAAVWRDVLELPRVAVDQDFFTLGGTSMEALEVVVRLERELGVEIPLRTLFEAPTIEGLAARLGTRSSKDEPIVVWLRRGVPGRAPLFCVFGVQLYQELAFALDEDRPVIGMHVPMRYVPGRDPRPTLEQIAARYVALLREYQPQGPYRLLGLCFGGIVAYEVARQLEAAGQRVESVAVIDAILPTAIRVDAGRRLRSAVGSAQRAMRARQDFQRWIRRGSATVAARVPLLAKLKAGLTNASTPIELPIDGPEVDAEIRRFAIASHRLAARLLIVRAIGEHTPDWMVVDAAHGWGQRAVQVDVHDIPADHLGVLKAPHVRSLARALLDGESIVDGTDARRNVV